MKRGRHASFSATTSGIDRSRSGKPIDLVQFVAFNVGGGEFAFDIMRIKEIINPVEVTRVPRAPSFIEGVIELRGAILPIVDMRRRFDLPATPFVRSTKYVIVVIDVQGRRMIVGLIVDRVSEPLRIARDQIRPAPVLAQSETNYFSGAVHHHGRILMILELDAILTSKEKLTLAGLGVSGSVKAGGPA